MAEYSPADPSINQPFTQEPSKRNRQQLSTAMEHMRRVVTVSPSTPSLSPTPPTDPSVTNATATDRSPNQGEPDDVYGVPTSVILPLRHKPTAPRVNNPQKRTDPFQFGSRYLEEGDDIFAYNAWDNVEVDDAYLDFAKEMYQKQRDNPVSDKDRGLFSHSRLNPPTPKK
jgi:tRNAThr (cytosine32-N3)-methyltransferase